MEDPCTLQAGDVGCTVGANAVLFCDAARAELPPPIPKQPLRRDKTCKLQAMTYIKI